MPVARLTAWDTARRRSAVWMALAFGVPLVVYVRTLAPTVYGLDSAELTTGAWALGIVHAPGSPTYMLLGHLFAQLPLGDVGYRLNLLSACSAALAVLFLFLVIRRLVGDPAVALAASWLAAFSYYVWVSAVAAELYAPHAAFVTALLLLALRWRDGGSSALLCGLGLLFGVAAGNHLSMTLLAPGFAWLIGSARRPPWQPPWLLVAAAAATLAGAAVYLYLPLRYLADPPLNYARVWGVDLSTPRGLLWMVSARLFSPLFFSVPIGSLPAEVGAYAAQLWSNFVGCGVVLGLVGVLGDFRARPSLHIGLALLFAAHLAFFIPYQVVDKALMFEPTFLVWAIWTAIGAQILCAALARRLPDGWSISAPALLFFLALGCLVVNYPRVDLRDDWSARQVGEQVFDTLEPYAVYFGTWKDVPILEYLQIVERQRPDVRTVNLVFARGGGPRLARQLLRQGWPVYTSAPELLIDDSLFIEPLADADYARVRLAAPHASIGGAAP